MTIKDTLAILKEKAEYRYNNFQKIPEWENLVENVDSHAYIQKPIWIWWEKKYVVLFIDLIDSTWLSTEKFKWTVAKVYDYFTQSIIDTVDTTWYYSYIDIKWDGVFIIYEWDYSNEHAFIDCINFRTFFSKTIKDKFWRNWITLKCKSVIYRDSLLVRKIWNRKFRNEVWAGRLINVASKLIKAPESKWHPQNSNNSYLVIDKEMYDYFFRYYKDILIKTCCKGHTDLWREYFIDNWILSERERFYVLEATWCDEHGDSTIKKLLP